jgi:uncharacterized protein YcgL (UPF0745 family)
LTKNMRTDDNMVDLVKRFKKDQKELQMLRGIGISVRRRPKTFYLFVDLKKAFDRVDRGLLMKKLRDR